MLSKKFALSLNDVAAHADLARYRKSRHGPNKPPRKRSRHSNSGHVSSIKYLLNEKITSWKPWQEGPFVIAGQSIQAQVFFDIATGGQQGQESQDPQGASDTEAQYFISFSTGSNKTQNNTDYD